MQPLCADIRPLSASTQYVQSLHFPYLFLTSGVPTFGFQGARGFSGPTYGSSQFHNGYHLHP